MSIDRQKTPQLTAALMAVALGFSTAGCRGSAVPESARQTPLTAITPTTVLPDICLTPSELLRPPSLSRESVITYPSGVVINQAGRLINLAINIPHLERLDNEPALGLNSPGRIKIIYFFAGSIYRPDAEEQVTLFFQAQRIYLLARYCQEQGKPAGGFHVIALSVADALAEGAKDADELARVLSEFYIQGTRIIIGDPINRVPRELPRDVVEEALAPGLPFRPFRVVEWYN